MLLISGPSDKIPRRFQAVIMGLFAGLALVLAVVGIYGVG